jgi:molybdate transport system substrate-binding protein
MKTRIRKIWLVAIVLGATLFGCKREDPSAQAPGTQPGRPVEVRIAAAADLRFAMDELAVRFHRLHPDAELKPTYGSSGNFFTQLTNKAPFDVFLSADADYPQKLVDQGLASRDTLFKYAVGHIVIWVPKDSPLDLDRLGIRAVAERSVQRIAIANPQHAPYGRAALAAMKAAGVYDVARERLVLGENIGQAAQFVESGSADVGILAMSLALAPQMKGKGRYVEIPADLYPPIEQGGVILSWATDRAAAERFRQFLLSDEARETLQRFGFAPPVR